MAYTTINKPDQYFNATAYTANGGIQTITNSGSMQPDWVWTKVRSTTSNNILINAIIGPSKYLYSNTTGTEVTDANYLTSFNSNGFSVGSNNYSNGTTMVAWQWRASNTTAVSNTQGTITSTVSANPTAGFSIVSFTTIAGGNATIGHGLGAVPKMIIMKARDQTYNWDIYHVSIGNANRLIFTSAASAGTPCWGSTTPTSSVFTMDQSFYGSGVPTIAYCFAEVKGYSKFGSYVGNGSANGTFVYTGFKPAFIMIKSSSSAAGNWLIQDNKRLGYNASNSELYANLTDAEGTNDRTDLLSNGFKARINSGENNSSGVTYIYMAFAENPFVSSTQIPTTAR